MKYKWVWTPNGYLRLVVIVLLLGVGGLLQKQGMTILSNIFMVLGLIYILYSLVRTSQNIKKHNINNEDTQELLHKLNDNWVSDSDKINIKKVLEEKGLHVK